MRNSKNIELMHQRRDFHYGDYGSKEYENDLDEWGRGQQVQATYYMLIEDAFSPSY